MTRPVHRRVSQLDTGIRLGPPARWPVMSATASRVARGLGLSVEVFRDGTVMWPGRFDARARLGMVLIQAACRQELSR